MPSKKKAKPKTEAKYRCEYCDKPYKSERRFLVHLCEKKRRYLCRDDKPNRVGFMIFQRFWDMNYRSKKNRTYDDFANSSLYLALVAFGRYINDINAIQPNDFIEFLLKGEVPIDKWRTPPVYEAYVRALARIETPAKAVERNFLLMQQWALDTGLEWTDFFRKIAPTQAVSWIISGRISPWVLYLAPSAVDMMNRFNEEQIGLVKTTIEPKFWAIKIKVNAQEVAIIREQLELAGL